MVNRKLARAIHIALITAGAASAGLCSSAMAQEDAAELDRVEVEEEYQEDLEMVLVTGTRIRDANITGTSPVVTVTSDDFKFSGTTRVEDLLVTFPQLAPSFDSFTVNPTTGFATADLRGLGSQRTLVLVNGHRMQPGGIRGEARDLNQIPAALVKRVEVLTGGASAVYGSDAVAGVVNFILDDQFTGVSFSAGISAYQHDNDDSFLPPKMDARGFSYPTGDSGFDGEAYNVDIAMGSEFADGRGHAMAYLTWRKNNELRQGARDYSSCALNAAATPCGGSSTAPVPNFLVFGTTLAGGGFGGFASQNQTTGQWQAGVGELYNYAPINHYQRPDDRYTFGSSVNYEVNDNFKPYMETMFSNTNTSVQIAESGTFFVNSPIRCDDPLTFPGGDLCATLGIRAEGSEVYIGKRNTEGGPRISNLESSAFRVVTGAEGDLFGGWIYNASYLYGRSQGSEANVNDFLIDRVDDAVRLCPPGSFGGCVPYNVWVPGGVTAEAAQGLGASGLRQGETQLTVLGAYATGPLPFTIPSADDAISLVFGLEYRKDEFQVLTDANMATGNFTGLGGPRLPIDGSISVNEIYGEAAVPLYNSTGWFQSLTLDLGYRHSDYSTSGGVTTFKIGGSAGITDYVRVRGGFNRAIRAPNVTELFADQQIALWSGSDPCAGATPEFTQAQCQNTGVSAGQYGNILGSPASQYNQFIGGSELLDPEEADTWTAGVVITPLPSLTMSIDYYDIFITDRIGTIGSNTLLRFCALSGDPFLCDKVNRNPTSGDLWVGSNLETSGYIENLNANFGDLQWTGIDFTIQHSWDLWGGTLNSSLVGSYNLEQEIAPLPGVNDAATFDCAGVINIACQTPDWRHTARFAYSQSIWTGSFRWRYVGGMDYVAQGTGVPLTTDQILVANGGKLDDWNYFDLSGNVQVTETINVTAGVNNIFDKSPPMVGSTLALNANAPGGYDQLGRYFFSNVGFRF